MTIFLGQDHQRIKLAAKFSFHPFRTMIIVTHVNRSHLILDFFSMTYFYGTVLKTRLIGYLHEQMAS